MGFLLGLGTWVTAGACPRPLLPDAHLGRGVAACADFIRTYNVVIDATGARPFMRIGKRRVALLDEHDLLPSEDDEPIHFAAGSPCIMQ